ncbi:ABC transporter permease subunit [Eubacterium sp. 1001713B170207_170306_E7]|uniref:ABC transporter permease subunit n=1 Tax=Eubacterium sp. 1001713B170207_170306_E7 TaxID=2787097 RepID=UPI001A9A8CFD|nr:ABC transporter permease subunit [Eubacterium sp. 1001713B170207_170306_E7]
MIHEAKEHRFFSGTLMKQNIKSNRILALVVLIIMVMMSTVINYAMSIMGSQTNNVDVADAQKDFYSYLYVMASYNEAAGTKLSYNDFSKNTDKAAYEAAFQRMNQKSGSSLSVDGLEQAAEQLEKSDVSLDTYIRQFEYTYALGQAKGCFDGEELNPGDMMTTMLEVTGVSPELVENMGNMDMTTMLNQMYFTVMGLLPIFIFIVIAANALLVDQVDRGTMAYVLSTPTRRSAVAITQAVFMIIAPFIILAVVCATRIASSFVIYDTVNVPEIITLYLGMYLLVEAIAGICYLGSCYFNQSKKSMAFGGGLTVWFFLASLLGMFGSQSMVDMGIGVEALGIFNKLTLIGLYDINAIATVGTESLDTAFIWKLGVLAGIALICYIAGAVRFQKKDLPL